MFKRNLLKRTLPVMLSVAMTFQSVPITAMAAENPPAAVQAEADEPEPAAEAVEEVSAEPEAEPVAEAPSDSEEVSDQGTENAADGESGEESAPEESADVVSGSETNDQENTGSGIEAEISEETKTGTDGESETNQAETADAAETEKAAGKIESTEINLDKLSLSGFTLERGAEDTYTTEYSTSDKFGDVVSNIKKAARIYVNGEDKISAESYLDTQWEKPKADGTWEDMSGRPETVGSYRLKLSLKAQDGLWGAVPEKYVYFNITKQELTLDLDGVNDEVKAGSVIEDFKADVKEKAWVEGKDTELIKDAVYKISAVKVYKNGEEAETGDKYFSKAVDYHFTVEVELLDAAMKDNCMVDCNGEEELKEYPIHFGKARKTKVEVAQPSNEIIKIYGKSDEGKKAWSITDIEEELTKLGVTTTVMVEAGEDENGDEDETSWVPLEKMNESDTESDTIKATPLWCVKENNKNADKSDEPGEDNEIDEDRQFLKNDGKDLYTILVGDDGKAETTVDKVGEYYLVYMYPGLEGAFEESYSEPIKVTIDPWPVILKPAEGTEKLVFNTSMTSADVARVLAKAKASFIDAEDRKDVAVTVEDGFYGVSYDSQGKEQYYNPVFKLMRVETPNTASGEKAAAPSALKEAKYDNKGCLVKSSDKYNYDYYIVFTGEKAVSVSEYDEEDGTWSWKIIGDKIPVTKPTDAANPNYKILADNDIIYNVDNALLVEVDDIGETEVDVDSIIKAFTGQHPQADSVDAETIGKALYNPLSMVYDPENGLFKGRADYKAAAVKKGGTVVKDNDGESVEKSHRDLTYTWARGSLDDYYDLIHDPRADKTNEDHEAWEAKLENFDFYDMGTSAAIPQDAGIYRLHIAYKDGSPAPTYAPSDGYVYFLIEKQLIMFKADNQYAEDERPVWDFTQNGYTLYIVSGNDWKAFDPEKAEEHKDWDASELFGSVADWYAVNKAKNADGTDKSPVEWVPASGNFDKSCDYRAAIWFDEDRDEYGYSGWDYDRYEIKDKNDDEKVIEKAGKTLYWNNYTTREWDESANGGKGDYVLHFMAGDDDVNAATYARILFWDRKQVVASVDVNPFEDKVYDGKAIDSTLAGTKIADLVTLKDDEGKVIAKEALPVSETLDAEEVVKVGWHWKEGGKVVPTSEAIYGGTYSLVATFEGNEDYKEIKGGKDTELRGWVPVVDKDGEPVSFEIKKLKVEIKPQLKKDEDGKDKAVTAGDPLNSVLGNQDVEVEAVNADDIPADDKWLFQQRAGRVESVVRGISSKDVTTGYPILGNGTFGTAYYENNESKTGDKLIRFGKNYNVELKLESSKGVLFAQYASSYELIPKSVGFKATERGDAKVGATNFFAEGSDTSGDKGRAAKAEEKKGRVSVYTKKEEDDKFSYVIKPQEGIPFVYKNIGENKTSLRKYDDGIYDWWSTDSELWAEIDEDLIKQLPLDKNYIAVNILSPREFSNEDLSTFAKNNFVFKNNIEDKKCGGYVIAEGIVSDDRESGISGGPDQRYAITALFPVEEYTNEDGKIEIKDPKKTFQITWEKGYTETFTLDLTGAKLEANLKKAVAPKSLAFNGVVTKMAIGEEQQLDVKITKAQLGDVIQIRYRLENKKTEEIKTNNEFASIDPETGLITALAIEEGKKTSQVTVEAYPVRLSADGKRYEEITGKGVKPATAKITINEVTAPAIKKIVSKDTSAEVQYTKVNDGYRREIYVKLAKDKKAAAQLKQQDFEDDIAAMKNGQWKEYFAFAPIYVYGSNEKYDAALKLCKKNLVKLEAGGKSYAVYVRNVSAVRTLADGSKVTESHTGSVKSFETTKSMVTDLYPYFEVVEEKSAKNPVRYIDDDPDYGYTVDLAGKSAQLLVKGRFLENASNPAADADDKQLWKLPLKTNDDYKTAKDMYGAYLEPKLSYFVTDGGEPRFDAKGKILNPSKYATISNSGKIALKGVGQDGYAYVELHVYADKANDSYTAYESVYLRICAKPDIITTKNPKPMKVGDGIRLSDYLNYQESKTKTKVPNYWSSNIVILNKDEVEKNGFKIDKATATGSYPVDGAVRTGEYIITAVEPGKTCTLKFTDVLWETDENGKVKRFTSEEQKLTLSSSALDQVKGLKAVYTDDKHITLNFTHAGHPEAFAIEVQDARGSVVFTKVISSKPDDIVSIDRVDGTKDNDPQPWLMNEQKGIVGIVPIGNNDSVHGGVLKYFEKTKTYAYTIYSEKLMRLSSYTISVDAVYNGVSAAGTKKVTSTKAKTTNIPASYGDADTENSVGNYYNPYNPKGTNKFDRFLLDASDEELSTYLVSGNTYTVKFDPQNNLALTRGTDTLTWKSSNTKVLSVKANQGSFTATVKPMQQGKATITVASKVTKKTIGRWYVAVKAVGNGSTYGGDFEWSGDSKGEGIGHTIFYDTFIKTYDPYYEGRVEVLTVSNSVTVEPKDIPGYDGINYYGENDYTWVQFTAPAYGEYTFLGTSDFEDNDGKAWEYYSGDKSKKHGTFIATDDGYELNEFRLEKSQKVYFKIYGTFTLKVGPYTDFTKLTVGADKPFKAKEDTWVSFTADEDNYYTFVSGSGEYRFEKNGNDFDDYVENWDNEGFSAGVNVGMKAGETLFIYVEAGDTLYVTKRVFEKELETGDIELKFKPNEEVGDQCQYVKYSPTIEGYYTFTHVPQDGVDIVLLHVDSNEEYDGEGDVVILATTFAEEGAGTETTPELDPEKWKLYIGKNEAVVFKVTVEKSAFGKDVTEIPVKITVGNTEVNELTEAGGNVTQKTIQTFWYTIPTVTDETTYKITAEYTADNTTEKAPISWYKAAGGSDNNVFEPVDGDEITFTVKDGKIKGSTTPEGLKAGEKIYIKVDASELTADVKVSIKKESPKAPLSMTNSSVKLTLPDDAGQYTFVVNKTGYYEFTAKVTGEQPKHNLRISGDSFNIDTDNADHVGKAVIKLEPGECTFEAEVIGDTTSEDKTDAEITVKEIKADDSLKVGPNTITVEKDEVKYYILKFDAKGSYNITWTQDTGEDKGIATVSYQPNYGVDNMVQGNYLNWASSTSKLDSTIRYIKVENNSEKATSITLQVDAKDEKGETLTNGAATVTFTENGSKTYTFITPDKSELGYTVIVENTITVPEGKNSPTIKVSDSGIDLAGSETGKLSQDMITWTKPYESKNITVTASGIEEGVSATAKITITPIAPKALSGESINIQKGDSEWRSVSITKADRYSVSVKPGENQSLDDCDVAWYVKESTSGDPNRVNEYISKYSFTDVGAEYLDSGKKLYVNVKAKDSFSAESVGVTVALAKTQTGTINLENGKGTEELTETTHDYYTFTADETANYTVTGGNPILLEPVDGNEEWENGSELKNGKTILIKVGHTGTLTVEKNNMLKADGKPAETTLAAGEKATFVFKPYVKGYYDFTISEPEKLTISSLSGYSNIYSGDIKGYKVINVSSKSDEIKPCSFTVTNKDPESSVTFTVTTGAIEPVELKLGTEYTLEKGRWNVFEFAVPKTDRYKFECSEGSKLKDESDYGIDGSGAVLDKSTDDDKETIYAEYSGAEASGKLKVTKLVPTPVTEEGITESLKAGEVKWYAYTAKEIGQCTIKVENANYSLYGSLTDEDNLFDDILPVTVKAGSTIYIKMWNSTAVETAKLTVKFDAMATLNLGENEVSNESDDEKTMTFQAAADGFYQFKFDSTDEEDTSAPEMWYYGTYFDEGVEILDDEYGPFYVAEGDVVFLSVYGKCSGKLTVTMNEMPEAEELKLNVGLTGQELEGVDWYTFTAKEGKWYYVSAYFVEEEYWGDYLDVGIYRSGSLYPEYDMDMGCWLNAGEKAYCKVSAELAGKYNIFLDGYDEW